MLLTTEPKLVVHYGCSFIFCPIILLCVGYSRTLSSAVPRWLEITFCSVASISHDVLPVASNKAQRISLVREKKKSRR